MKNEHNIKLSQTQLDIVTTLLGAGTIRSNDPDLHIVAGQLFNELAPLRKDKFKVNTPSSGEVGVKRQ